MATKAELEKELKEAQAEVKKVTKLLTGAEDKYEAAAKQVVWYEKERGRLKEELDKALAFEPEGDRAFLTPALKEDLSLLSAFLFKLYRESNWTPVRRDIQRWRNLLAKLIE